MNNSENCYISTVREGLSRTIPPTHTHINPLTLSLSLSLSFSLSLSHSLTHSLTLSLTHLLTHLPLVCLIMTRRKNEHVAGTPAWNLLLQIHEKTEEFL